jgi:hypothetical protein
LLLRFFRINDPYRLLGLLVILIILSIFFLMQSSELLWVDLEGFVLGEAITGGKRMYVEVYDDSPPFAALLYGFMDLVFGRSILARQIVAMGIVFFQSAYFAILLINNKAHHENTYLPAFIVGLLCFISFEVLTFSPDLMASTVLLFALNHLFHEIEFKIQRDDTVLKLGVYLGVATFLVFSYWIFLVLSLFILIIFTRPGLRKIALLLFGFFLPHALLLTLYSYWGEADAVLNHFYIANLTNFSGMRISGGSLWTLGIMPLTYFGFSILMTSRVGRLTKYQSQLMQVMYLWLIFSFVHLLIARNVSTASVLTFIPPLAYFISNYLLLIRRKWIAEAMLWIFLIGVISLSALAKAGKIEKIDLSGLVAPTSPYHDRIQDERVMILGPDVGLYRTNSPGGYFLDWEQSRSVFESPITYEKLDAVATCFMEDAPTVIIDEGDRMGVFFERISGLKERYRKEGKIYRLIE